MANDRSAQPCGCDEGVKGGPYYCERHREMIQRINPSVGHASPNTVASAPSGGAMEHVTVVHATSQSPEWRKQRPLWSGVLRYFPDALLEVAHVSYVGNEQHNPGQPLHWDRSKSQDEGDACARHLVDAGKFDTDGTRHSAKAAWRALALLQKELEDEQNQARAEAEQTPKSPH